MNKDRMTSESKEYLKVAEDPDTIQPGQIIRRINSGKDHQGRFTGKDDNNGFILVNVIDLSAPSYAAPAGIIRHSPGDIFYFSTETFQNSLKTGEAMDIITRWPLYSRHPELQSQIIDFARTSYSPAQIVEMAEIDELHRLFIPIQEKLRIGRFETKEDPEQNRYSNFSNLLKNLKPGEHITYLAMIPSTKSFKAKFYSIGTKPHEETLMSLRSESFNFKPTHGGHIKSVKSGDGIILHVDAGSSFIGKGVKAKLDTAAKIAHALKKEYKDFTFKPLEGRGAFGTEQSY
jgi:hypothetical protein